MRINLSFTKLQIDCAQVSQLSAYVGVQVVFWFLLHTILSLYLYLAFNFIEGTLQSQISIDIRHLLAYALFFAVVHGFILGISSYFIDKMFNTAKPAGLVIATQIIVSIIVFVFAFAFVRYFTSTRKLPESSFTEENWAALFRLLFAQYILASVVVVIGNQMLRKYGPDVFIPLLLSMYRKPKEERRIFLFIDIKSSTALAEKLGHVLYSNFVRDFMMDVNNCLFQHRANVYQYAGDEAVITWRLSSRNIIRSVNFFLCCKSLINRRSDWYNSKYGTVPSFKAGADCGLVTAVEVGDMKRDIAYHGDVVNTASRIQGLCNVLQKEFLVSDVFFEWLSVHKNVATKFVGSFILRGKEKEMKLFSVEV